MAISDSERRPAWLGSWDEPGDRPFQPRIELGEAPAGHESRWRRTFGDLWSALALQLALQGNERRSSPGSDACAEAAGTIDQAEGRLIALIEGESDDSRGLLFTAASMLESCALTWSRIAPVGGDRRVLLLRQMERRLTRGESLARCGEQSYAQAASPAVVHAAALRARHARPGSPEIRQIAPRASACLRTAPFRSPPWRCGRLSTSSCTGRRDRPAASSRFNAPLSFSG